jgi:ribose transport system ATP-binding protein
VFRDGRHVTTQNGAEITPGDVGNAMVGREIGDLYPEKQSIEAQSRHEVLRVENLCEAKRFRDVTFTLRQGEILGFAGLIGAGRSEIAKGVCALEGRVTGDVWLHGQKLALRDYRDSIDAGMGYLSEDRKGDGLFLDLSIASNVSALKVEQVARTPGLIQSRREDAQADRLGRKLNLKCGGLQDPVSSLSGGNQQKVAIAKMLSVDPRLIFLDEPTRGVDVGAKVEIHRILRDLANEGVGIVVISSELPELIGVCDRVLVIHEGRMRGEVTGDQMTEENIMHLASGTDVTPQAAE